MSNATDTTSAEAQAAAAAAAPGSIPSPADVAAAAAKAAGTTDPPAGETPAQVQARLEADIARLTREKDDIRVQAKGTIANEAKLAQLTALAKAIGIELPEGEKPTVESLTEKLTGATNENATLRTTAQEAQVQRGVVAEAWKQGVNPAKADYLDFVLSKNADFKSLDPAAADFGTKLSAIIAAELTKDSSLKATGGSSTSGAEHFGGAGDQSQMTKEQFNKLSVAEQTALFRSNKALFERLSA